MKDQLKYLAGVDLPFFENQVFIHQPRIREIGFIGEENFFTGCQFLNFSKEILDDKDNVDLKEADDFDILIAILEEQNAVMQKYRNCMKMVLAILFPEYTFTFDFKNKCISLKKDREQYNINKDNFKEFKEIISRIFLLDKKGEEGEYNPNGATAKRIADKLKKRQQKLAEVKNEQGEINIIARYISIMSVGLNQDMNSFMDYTYFQLVDEYERYMLKISYDNWYNSKMAGASDLEDPEDWMQDIHDPRKKKNKK